MTFAAVAGSLMLYISKFAAASAVPSVPKGLAKVLKITIFISNVKSIIFLTGAHDNIYIVNA